MPGRRLIVSCLVLLGLALLGHLPALQAVEFHYDDGHSLVRNPHIRDVYLLPAFFLDPSLFSENPTDAMYRPLVLSAHALNQWLMPDRPTGFLALNLGLHALVVVLLFGVLRQLLPHAAALAGAALFALHPLQSEVVNYISARSESLVAAGILIVLGSFLHYRRDGRTLWLVTLVAGQLLALGAKEVGVITPLLLLVIGWLRPQGPVSRWRPAVLLSGAIVGLYLIVYQSFSYGSGSGLRSLAAQGGTQTKALIYYLRAVIMPVDLSVAPQFRQSQGLDETAVVLAGLALISAAALAWICRRRAANAALGLLWFIICLLPTLIVPLNVLVNDHRPYLALAGLVLALAALLARYISAARLRGRPLLAAAGLILLALCWQRAADWRTEISLWKAAVTQGPMVASAHHNLAVAYQGAGQMPLAQQHYEAAIRMQPDYARPLTNLGALYRDQGRLPEAEAVLVRALQADPAMAEAANNLGLVYQAQARPEQALSAYQAALQADASIADIWYNLGLVQRDLGRRQEAVQSLQRALQLDPSIQQRLGPGSR